MLLLPKENPPGLEKELPNPLPPNGVDDWGCCGCCGCGCCCCGVAAEFEKENMAPALCVALNEKRTLARYWLLAQKVRSTERVEQRAQVGDLMLLFHCLSALQSRVGCPIFSPCHCHFVSAGRTVFWLTGEFCGCSLHLQSGQGPFFCHRLLLPQKTSSLPFIIVSIET